MQLKIMCLIFHKFSMHAYLNFYSIKLIYGSFTRFRWKYASRESCYCYVGRRGEIACALCVMWCKFYLSLLYRLWISGIDLFISVTTPIL